MSLRTLATVLILGFVLVARPGVHAGEVSDKFVGAWRTTARFAGYDQTLTIANNKGQWTVQGTFEKDGAVVGVFVGDKTRFAGDKLTYLTKYVKKPVEAWGNDDVTLRFDAGAIQMTFPVSTGEIYARTFARMPGEPKVVAKTPGTEPAKTKLQATVEEKFAGTWKNQANSRFDEYWTVALDGSSFKITGTFLKNGKEIGSCHGTEITYSKDLLHFRRVFDKKPDPKLGNSTLCIFKATEAGVALIVGGGATAKGDALKRAEAPMVVAKENGKPDPKTAAAARKNDGNFLGLWIGTFPNGGERLNLDIIKDRSDWIVEAYVLSADGKRLAYFRELRARTDDEGKSMVLKPAWIEKAAPITGEPAMTLTPQPSGLRAELYDDKMAMVVELTRGDFKDLKQFALLKPPGVGKGKPPMPMPGGKTTTVEIFKLPRDIEPAKPFAILDAKQHVISLAVSPDGKRVAVGSQQTLGSERTGEFTADLAVWDVEQQKQIWIKKKLVTGDVIATVRPLAFSGDGKILAANPNLSVPGSALRFYDAQTGQELKSWAPLKMRFDCVAFHPTKLLLAIGTAQGFNGQLELIDPRTGKSLWTVPKVHPTEVNGLAFSPDGETIATFGRVTKGNEYCVKLFDAAKGALLHEFTGTSKGIANSVIFSGDGKLIAALFGDLNKPALVIWDAATKEEVRRITDLATGGHSTRHNIAFLADDKTLAVSCWDRHLHLFDVTTGQRVGIYPRTYGTMVSEVFAVGDGRTLLSNRFTDGLYLWKQSDALPPVQAASK